MVQQNFAVEITDRAWQLNILEKSLKPWAF